MRERWGMSLVGVGWSGNGGVVCLVDEFGTGLPEVNGRSEFFKFLFCGRRCCGGIGGIDYLV